MAEPDALLASAEDIDRHVRRVAPDRWLAARLIADATARTQVLAFYALDDELARIAPAVSQPMLGAIRLQWWREALERAAAGGAGEHPVIAALAPALQAGRLAPERLDTLVAAHEADLEPAPFADEAALVAWLDGTFGSVMALAARLLGAEAGGGRAGEAGEGAAVLHAGRAWGWSALLRAEPAWRVRGREPWPPGWPPDPGADVRTRIDAALRASRGELAALPTAAFPAVAYAALAPRYASGAAPSELGRRARLLWATARGRID